ncbi:piggyBac transposable element-derived protein 3-like [Hydra vulgaris]|uniref:piggyBac transposable element-derived protein 3-like n=1 Tax=Hydra vulgaris TaxID=6087 RepID=UPI001F5FE896|nr:piggyBac transposable element-derived protein 3-like [Hydra vulgaris]
MDNLFTSIKLFNTLKDHGIWAVGTIRNNRLHGAEKVMFKKKEQENMGRGSLDYRVDFNSNITVIRWMDNGVVQLASTFIGPSIGDSINRWSSKDKVVVKVSCPDMIHQYNKHMGGVDLSIVNGWILYKRHCKQNGYPRKNIIQLLEFQTRIADSLLREKKVSRGRPRSDTPVVKKKRCAVNAPAKEICLDNVGHLPNFSEKQQRCKHCKCGYSRIFCEKYQNTSTDVKFHQ